MKVLFILNDPPYGTERSYNGLRLAHALMKPEVDAEITVFLMADAVGVARQEQRTPEGYYNMERMIERVAHKGTVLTGGMCMDVRGLGEKDMIEGAQRSSMDALAAATAAADKVLVF